MSAGRRRRTPLFWVTGGLLGGQAAAAVVGGSSWEWLLVLAALVPVGPFVLCRRHASALVWASVMALLAAAVGHWQLDRRLHPRLPPDHVERLAGMRVVLRGRIAERPAPRPATTQLVLETAAARRGA